MARARKTTTKIGKMTKPVLVSNLQGTLPARAIENGRGEPVELIEVYAGVAWD